MIEKRRYKVDFLRFTFKDNSLESINDVLEYVEEILRYKIENYEKLSPLNFYPNRLMIDDLIQVLWGNEQGINIILSGTVLTYFGESKVNEILKQILYLEELFTVTRIDFCIDTDKDFSFFYNKVTRKHFVCKQKTIKKYINNENRGTIYFGSRASNGYYIRIYDKALEQDIKDEIITRIEIECKNIEKNMKLIRLYLLDNNFIGGIILDNLKFLNDTRKGKRMDRLKTNKEYLKIIENKEENTQRIIVERKETSIDRWFINQVAPSLKAFIKLYGEDELIKMIEKSKISLRSYSKLNKSKKLSLVSLS